MEFETDTPSSLNNNGSHPAGRISFVVPTNRPEHLTIFLEAWRPHLHRAGARLIIVGDGPERSCAVPTWAEHYCWPDINGELGDDRWIISRRSASIRSYGLLKAWEHGSDIIITMDDDCLPETEHAGARYLEEMQAALETRWPSDRWWNTMGGNFYPRGYPYGVRDEAVETVLHHGLWSHIPDFDAQTQSKFPNERTAPAVSIDRVPTGRFFPMSSMNLGFKRKALPLLYFLLMGEDDSGHPWGYDRFDDIWAGLFFKKIADHQGWAVSSGHPSIRHSRASSVEANMLRERSGLAAHEDLWKRISRLHLHDCEPLDNYLEIASSLRSLKGYWARLADAMGVWASLFTGTRSANNLTNPPQEMRR